MSSKKRRGLGSGYFDTIMSTGGGAEAPQEAAEDAKPTETTSPPKETPKPRQEPPKGQQEPPQSSTPPAKRQQPKPERKQPKRSKEPASEAVGEGRGAPLRAKRTFNLRTDIVEELRGIAFAVPGTSINRIVEEALEVAIQNIRDDFNGGKPFEAPPISGQQLREGARQRLLQRRGDK